MKTLNKKQLAFLLEISNEDARAKMCVAWCEENEIENIAKWNNKNKIIDNYPFNMPIELLAKRLNIPNLQVLVEDIKNNYLVRSATKKYILNDFPEKHIAKCNKSGYIKRINLPAGLKSLLNNETIIEIKSYWTKHYPRYA
jgi:hypothetical protein